MIRLSLSARITWLLGLSVVVLVGGAALLMDQLVDREVSTRMDNALLAQAKTLVTLVRLNAEGLGVTDRLTSIPTTNAAQTDAAWSIHCDNGTAASSQPAPPDGTNTLLHTLQPEPTFVDVGDKPHVLRAVAFRFHPTPQANTAAPGVACSMLFMHPRGAMDDVLSDIDDILLVIPLLALAAALLLSPLLVRQGLKPLAALGEAMHDIGPRVPGQRLQATGTRELEPLVTRFNGVLARMDEGVSRERQFAGALAHETRTHLAELRALVEVEQRYPSRRPFATTLAEVGTIVEELQHTVSSLLLLTRLEAGIEGMQLCSVSLGAVVENRLQGVEKTIQERRLEVVHAIPDRPAATVVADRSLLDIVVGNLVHNAAAYAPIGSVVRIAFGKDSLTIDNDAPDVDASEVPHFGQRFWSKHHGTDGHTGLGLALAGAAASAMHMDLAFSLDSTQRLHATLSWARDEFVIAPLS